MCVGVPGEVVAVEGSVATLDVFGAPRQAQLELLGEPVAVGEWVLVHLGFAMRKIAPEEVGPMREAYRSLLAELEAADPNEGEPEPAPR